MANYPLCVRCKLFLSVFEGAAQSTGGLGVQGVWYSCTLHYRTTARRARESGKDMLFCRRAPLTKMDGGRVMQTRRE